MTKTITAFIERKSFTGKNLSLLMIYVTYTARIISLVKCMKIIILLNLQKAFTAKHYPGK